MKRLILFTLLAAIAAVTATAETVEEIRSNKAYLTGYGYGETLELARNAALADILSKITVTVKSDFLSNESETHRNGSISSEARVEMTVHSYSSATLNNVRSMVVKNEPDAEVLMWLPKAEVDKIFAGRLEKAREFVRIANEALANNQVDDALRYYYWAYKLTETLRRPSEATISVDGEERKMQPWLYAKIDNVMANVRMSISRRIDENTWELNATYADKPVRSMGYTYFDGVDNTLATMRDGRGLVELRPGASPSTLQVKVEFEFRDIARTVDHEIEDAMKAWGVSRFPHAYTDVQLPGISVASAQASAPSAASTASAATNSSPSRMVASSSAVASTSEALSSADIDRHNTRIIEPVMLAISGGNIQSVKGLFTAEGFNEFQKIMGYGKVRLLPESEVQYFSAQDGGFVCRGIAVSCRFSGRRTFSEQLSLAVGKDGLIHHVSMGLGKQLAQDIALNYMDWTEESRKRLVDFLEDYRTAYAMKDIDYMERVLDDNALIVVGRRNVQVATQFNEDRWQMNQRVQLTKQTKKEFIKNLRRSFASKEYINLIFSNSRIIKPRPDKEIYSIEVKQEYFSSNYGDSGYLTLVMDLTDPANPVIHVRTWQEQPDPNFGVISIVDL